MSTSSEYDSDEENINESNADNGTETSSNSEEVNDTSSESSSSGGAFDSGYINDVFQETDPANFNANQLDSDCDNIAMAALIEEHHLTMHDLKSLIAKGMKLDQVNAEGQTLLMLVALHNHDPNVSKMVPLLLEEGNGAAVDLKGDNALIYALHNTSFNLNLVKELIHLAGDDILFRVLDVLEQEADEEFVEFLSSVIPIAVSNGADPFGKKNGRTLFFELAEISTNTSEDISPIFDALAKVAKAKSPSELASLLDELNPSYSEGESPLVALTVSIRVGDVRFVEELLKAGANPSKAEYVEIDTTPEIVSLMKRYKNSYTAKSTALAPPPKKGRTAVRAPPTTEAEPAPRARGSTPELAPAVAGSAAASNGCPSILKTGPRKGEACGKPATCGGFCGMHKTK